jgi:hypothetical protein
MPALELRKMEVARGRTRAEAWLDAVSKIEPRADGGRVYNLVIEIEEPSAATPASRKVEQLVDAALRDRDEQPIITVAETIFPMTEYKQGGLEAVYAYPKTIYPHIRSISVNRQGTYALRLVERKCYEAEPFNPLKTMIEKMRDWIKRDATRRAIYEVDMALEPAELKFYEAETDKDNHISGQCLSHLSFKLGADSELYLTAMYRYQYLIKKGLGNFRGLASLQAVVAKELGIPVGPLVVHATLGCLDVETLGGIRKYEALVRQCREVMPMEVA